MEVTVKSEGVGEGEVLTWKDKVCEPLLSEERENDGHSETLPVRESNKVGDSVTERLCQALGLKRVETLKIAVWEEEELEDMLTKVDTEEEEETVVEELGLVVEDKIPVEVKEGVLDWSVDAVRRLDRELETDTSKEREAKGVFVRL